MRYLSVCSGIEAASVAWEPLGFVPVAFAEIDAFPSRVLAHHWPQVPNLGDFTRIDVAALGAVDLLVGGTPCQAFSVAGRRRSLADARGNLSLAYAELFHALVATCGTRWALWENVPGVLSTPDNAFGCLLGALTGGDDAVPLPPGIVRWPDAGLVAGPRARAAWRILDAQYFGLAQRRRRVFVVVGAGDGADPAAVLFEPQGLRRHPPSRGEAGESFARPLAAGSPGGSGYRHDADTAENLIAHALRGEGFDASEDGTGRGTPIVPVCFDPRQTDVLVHGDKTGPLDTKYPGPAIAFDTTQITSKTNRCNPQPGDPCHPLASGAHAPAIASATPWAVRRLTPVECHRLQGFPDDHAMIPGAKDGPVYKALGNSKAVPVVRWIGARIAAADRDLLLSIARSAAVLA